LKALGKGVHIVYAWNTAAFDLFREAKNRSMLCVLDQAIGHPRAQIKILQEELKVNDALCDVIPSFGEDLELKRWEGELELADKVVVGSEFAKETLTAYGVNPEKIVVIPYGVDTALFHPAALEKKNGAFYILTVGGFDLRKGGYYLLEAIRQLDLPNVHLLIAGTRGVPSYARPYARFFTYRPYSRAQP
jgi:glycosyltransferase involved in cell wall biosynthesis